MRAFSFIRVGVALATVAGVGAGVVQAGPAFAGANYQYSITGRVHEDFTTSGVGEDTGLCDPVEHIVLDGNEAVHITATQPGLSDDEVRTLLEEDPDGILLRSSYRLTGEFVAETASGHVYSGRVTWGFMVQAQPESFIFTGTFSALGISELGTMVGVHFDGHFTFTNGVVHVDRFNARTEGCLP